MLRERGIIPLVKSYDTPKNYSDELAEAVGIFLGDGGLNESQICVTLNSIADKEYSVYVADLEKRLFGQPPGVVFRKDSKAVVLSLNGISLVKY